MQQLKKYKYIIAIPSSQLKTITKNFFISLNVFLFFKITRLNWDTDKSHPVISERVP